VRGFVTRQLADALERKSAAGQEERRYRPRPPTVRCSTDSGHIAALPRTGALGHFWTHALQQTALHSTLGAAQFLIQRSAAWRVDHVLASEHA
jgi:hypothetical protein